MSLFLDQTFASTGLAAILFGIVGLGCVVSWPLLPSRRGALMVQGTGACAFALHFALIGAPTASAACVLSLMQLTVALVVRDRVAKHALDGATLLAGALESWLSYLESCGPWREAAAGLRGRVVGSESAGPEMMARSVMVRRSVRWVG